MFYRLKATSVEWKDHMGSIKPFVMLQGSQKIENLRFAERGESTCEYVVNSSRSLVRPSLTRTPPSAVPTSGNCLMDSSLLRLTTSTFNLKLNMRMQNWLSPMITLCHAPSNCSSRRWQSVLDAGTSTQCCHWLHQTCLTHPVHSPRLKGSSSSNL